MDGDRFDEYESDLEAMKKRDNYEKPPEEDLDVEYGAELTPDAAPLFVNNRVKEDKVDAPDHPEPNRDLHSEEAGVEAGGATMGWIGLVLAIASLFIYPAVLGTGGIVLGIIAYVQGSRSLGAWSVILGGIALLSFVVLVPYYT